MHNNIELDFTDQVDIEYPGLLEIVYEKSIEEDSETFFIGNCRYSFAVIDRNKQGQVLRCDVYLPNDDMFSFESSDEYGSYVFDYEKEPDTVIEIDLQSRINQERMITNDLIPIMMENKVIKVPEFNSKCCICGSPCNKKNKISICNGGCK